MRDDAKVKSAVNDFEKHVNQAVVNLVQKVSRGRTLYYSKFIVYNIFLTDKFRNRVYNLRTYLELAMPKIVFIVDKLLKEDPTAKLHLTTFGDYPTAQNHNENATYCYRYELTTSNKETFLTAVKTVDSTYGGIDKKESSLTAILYTATEPKIKWSSKDTKRVVKII